MVLNGVMSIFRFTNPADTETAISDKIEFNGNAAVPDAKSFIKTIKPIMSIIGQENETPDSNNPSNIDETGLALVGLEINGYFKANEATRPLAIRNIRNWFKQGNQKTADFPHGRFGIRNDIDDEFDLAPSATSGYIIEHFECVYDYSNRDYPFLLKLRFQNEISDLNT